MNKLITCITAASILLFACGQAEKPATNNCKEYIENFDYSDFDKFIHKGFICSKSDLQIGTLPVYLFFDDKNYTMLAYRFDRRFVYDKRNDLVFCFCFVGETGKKGIKYVHILNKALMPLYTIFCHKKEGRLENIYTYKHSYENDIADLYICRIEIQDGTELLKDITYANVVQISKRFMAGRYNYTNDCYYSGRPYFINDPFWIDLYMP